MTSENYFNHPKNPWRYPEEHPEWRPPHAQDARERAWQQERADRPGWWPRAQFDAGWDAAKREDEQRIAELVAALMETTAALGGAAEQIKALGSTPSENAVRAVERGIEQVRALAGEEG